MIKAIAFAYLLAVFMLLPTIGSAYQTRHITTRGLIIMGLCCAWAMLELCLVP